jgi:DNA-binding NarL/FixJ family response regulator
MLRAEVYISPALAQEMSSKDNDLNPIDLLSDRELEVVEYLIAGLGAKEISNKMDVGITTISTFRARAYEKFGVDNIIELKEKFFLCKDV